ncbi:MAG: acetyl-CoA acetyltransferase [Hyphomonadaceae bacterium]
MSLSPDRIPVIAGIGEIADRPKDVTQALEPVALMVAAARLADAEARGLLSEVDSIDIVGLVSWRYSDTAALLCEKLGVSPKRAVYGPVGGESPIRYLHEAARRIANGESVVGLVTGGEAQHAVNHAKRAGVELPWTPYAVDAPRFQRAADYVHALAVRQGVAWPINVYPLYDIASAHHWGQTPEGAQQESALLWAANSAAAARNPYAWLRKELTPAEIATPSGDNRMISWPYPKRMVANPNVNQGAAIIITSLAKARAAGIPEDQLAFIGAGAVANEPRDWLTRPQFVQSHAQAAVLNTMQRHAGSFDAVELYSCFPVVPKLARRTLGLPMDHPTSVTGGLSFFGGPLNNYMSHAACAMVRKVRAGTTRGLLYGQGEFVTKHHALIVGREPQARDNRADALIDMGAQAAADPVLGPPVPIDETPDGEGTLETFTVLFDPSGQPAYGAVIARLDSGARTLARVPADGADDLALLMSAERYPVGLRGRLRTDAAGLPQWRANHA